LHTRTISSTEAGTPENCPSKVTPAYSVRSEGTLYEAASRIAFDIGSHDLVCQFVEQVVAKNASGLLGNGRSLRSAIDWEAVKASVAESNSLEQAIGRAVVIADQMCRGVFEDSRLSAAPLSTQTQDAFFRFSVVDVAPDFGDESRYRSKMARSVARIFGIRRTAAIAEGGTG
jgi:hypothetical protein